MLAPYIAPPEGGLPNYYEYWQKSAAANTQIDFFVVTNLDVSKYKKYDNIHYILLTADEYWDKVQACCNFPIERSYYKSGEYRPLFGMIFKDILKSYDYWGSTEFDMIYGDILKFIGHYFDEGADVIGQTGPFRFIKNNDRLNYIAFYEVKGFKHPLTLEMAYSNAYVWYFVEPGMEIRYYQNGIHTLSIEDFFADIDRTRKPFQCHAMDGDLGLIWENGKLFGYNEHEEKEFVAAHLQKRKIAIDSEIPGETFCIIPNRILNTSERCMDINVPTLKYSVQYYRDTLKRVLENKRYATPEYRKIWAEIYKYCEDVGIFPRKSLPIKMFYVLRRFLFWK